MRWLSLAHPDVFAVTMAIPNEGKTSWSGGKAMKMAGVKAGAPDLIIPVAMKGYHGLFVEMKSAYGKLQPKQKDLHGLLRMQNYQVSVCWSCDEFIEVVQTYLE